MNLEYAISLEYDLALHQADWEYLVTKGKILFIPTRYFPIFPWIGSISLIVWGLLEEDTSNSG